MEEEMDDLTWLRNAADTTDGRAARIRQARAQGRTWEQISDALRMSRAGVIKLSKK